MSALKVSIFDPTGNITALVESPVPIEEKASVAAAVTERFPEVEQLGFVRIPEDGERACLRMAGGEFCGNASMSAAALCLLRRGRPVPDGWEELRLAVSGLAQEVPVRLRREGEGSFLASVAMPPAQRIGEIDCALGELRGKLPFVQCEGISHVLVTPDSAIFALLDDRKAAAMAAQTLCAALDARALGVLFAEGEAPRLRLTPLVWVPGSGSLCWESSCASGSAAAGMLFSKRAGAPVSLELSEPGGVLHVESDFARGATSLSGRTRLVCTEEL